MSDGFIIGLAIGCLVVIICEIPDKVKRALFYSLLLERWLVYLVFATLLLAGVFASMVYHIHTTEEIKNQHLRSSLSEISARMQYIEKALADPEIDRDVLIEKCQQLQTRFDVVHVYVLASSGQISEANKLLKQQEE